MIYLDNAATTLQKPPQVIDAVVRAMTAMGNAARGAHGGALEASRTVYGARGKMKNRESRLTAASSAPGTTPSPPTASTTASCGPCTGWRRSGA